MNIPTAKYLKNKAGRRLAEGKEPKKVVLVYAGISAAMALLTTAVRYALSHQISQTGGLQNMGIRSILSTADSILPILETVLMMCLGLGYLAAMLRISRRQYASPRTLKAGLERFWPLLCSKLLQGLIYAGIAFGVFYAALAVFMVSPFSNRFMNAMTPYVSEPGVTPEMLLANDALLDSLFGTLTPMLIIYAAMYLPLVIFFSYRYRMTDYIIVDKPGTGAVAAMRESRMMMRGNALRLFKVDLSFWWYYLLRALATVLLDLDIILAIFGVALRVATEVSFFGCAILYLAADFCINYFFMNTVSVTQALAYTSLVPKEEKQDGVVLGNIFQM